MHYTLRSCKHQHCDSDFILAFCTVYRLFSKSGELSRYCSSLRAGRCRECIPVRGGEIFNTRPDRPRRTPTQPPVQCTVSFPWIKRPGRGVNLPSPSSAEVTKFRSLPLPQGPGSSVGIATGYGLHGPGIESRWGEIFRPSRPALGPTQPPA